ncbi:MAG: DNA polymerase domain-containing protein [Candidatus Hodarchaeales archaeon]|jgi:DNA polymerase-2
MVSLCAWLHDVAATDWGVNTYWITPTRGIKAFYPLTVEFFLAKTDQETQNRVLSHPEVDAVEEVSKYVSIHDWQASPVLRVRVNPAKIRTAFEDLRKQWGEYLYNADLSIYQQFCFQTGLFPYVYAKINVTNGRLHDDWELLEHYLQADYRTVPFRTLWMQPFFAEQNFSRGPIREIHMRHSLVNQEEEPVVFAEDTETETLRESMMYLNRVDPDILFTSGGDTFFPILAQRATDQGVGYLHPGRGKRRLYSYVRKQNRPRGHSYMSYGRVFYSQHGSYLDGGRHHYDVGNSFMWKEGSIDGIHELVRLGCSDPQRIARATIGTALTAVQMRTAYSRNILIPGRKADSEDFRPASTMMSDVGGLVFSPQVGFHQNLVELDFLSMYPSIMVNRNVSPDTINCSCCTGIQRYPVPETDHYICTQRPGLVSLALKNILDRRAHFKSKRKEHQRYNRKQKVLKWLLVCSFGYQGYRNARFGRIEAHEAISAYGREALTRTNQIAIEYGLQVVAGIVDSIWLKNSDDTPIEQSVIDEICQRIEAEVKLPLEHAANYHWIVFLPRRHEPTIGVLNRYYGLKTDDSYKIRGIEIRQSSSPLFVKKLQRQLLKILSTARTHEEFMECAQKAKRVMRKYLADLKAGTIPLSDLLVTIRPSRGPDEYVSNTRQAIAARQLVAAGVKVEAGVKLSYLILDAYASDPTKRVRVTQLLTGDEKYDYQEYRKLCIRAYEGLIPPEMEQKRLTIEEYLS